jgi:hypothetical protein
MMSSEDSVCTAVDGFDNGEDGEGRDVTIGKEDLGGT